jgi:hypothetical protein
VSATADDKTYDGNTTAVDTLSNDAIAGDTVTQSNTAANFDTKDVGTNKTVTVTGISLGGGDAGNYTFNDTATAFANITARSLTVTASGSSKVYDGNTSATVTFHDDRVSGDDFTVTGTASFSDKNVGTGKTVSVTGIDISGTNAGDYTLGNTTTSTTADITAKALTISATGVDKVYDTTTAATVTLSDDRVSGDVFTDSYTSAAFADANVGTGKAVSVSGMSISGTDAGNYTFNTTASTTANITKADTVTSLADGLNPSVGPDKVRFTASVTPSATTTGTVTFSDSIAGTLGTVSLDGSGQAILDVEGLKFGSHTITATYGGDGNHNGSTTGVTHVVVVPGAAGGNNGGGGGGGQSRGHGTNIAPGAFGGQALNQTAVTSQQKAVICRAKANLHGNTSTGTINALVRRLSRILHLNISVVQAALNDPSLCQ